MKLYSGLFSNENATWSAHKARNILVHEVGKSFSERELKSFVQTFQKEIHHILKTHG